jgi:hypothetical protein
MFGNRIRVHLLLDDRDGDVGGADLLRDAARLPVLDSSAPQLVQDLRLARVDVAKDADLEEKEEEEGEQEDKEEKEEWGE